MASCERWLRARRIRARRIRARRIRKVRATVHSQVSSSASAKDPTGCCTTAERNKLPSLGVLLVTLLSAREVPVEEQRQKIRGNPPAELNRRQLGRVWNVPEQYPSTVVLRPLSS